MKLLLDHQRDKLLANGRQRWAEIAQSGAETDFEPVVKLFTPDAGATWLLTDMDPESPGIVFGLCDLGLGFPEMGSVSLMEIESVRGRVGLPVERDRSFKARYPLSVYAEAARARGAITEDDAELKAAVGRLERERRDGR